MSGSSCFLGSHLTPCDAEEGLGRGGFGGDRHGAGCFTILGLPFALLFDFTFPGFQDAELPLQGEH